MLQAMSIIESAERVAEARPIPKDILLNLTVKTRIMSGILERAERVAATTANFDADPWFYGALSYWKAFRRDIQPILSAATVTEAQAAILRQDADVLCAFGDHAEGMVTEHGEGREVVDAYAVFGQDISDTLCHAAWVWKTQEASSTERLVRVEDA
ncbi:MAG: hypothetical protein GF331_19715 [Chitinivibrionales bacterium]|nr:hypothetical protein [Chitinivibrionales bacterium]